MSFRIRKHSAEPTACWLALAGLAVLAAVLLFRGGGTLAFGAVGSDLVSYFYPFRSFVARWLQRGVYPFWNPHVFGGYPVAETQQMALFNPVSLLCAVLPPVTGLIAMTALHTALGLAGCHVMLRRAAGLRPSAALVGSVVLVFGAANATRVTAGHVTVVAAVAYWPVALLALMRAAQSLRRMPLRAAIEREPQWFVLAALASALVVLAGAPQYVVYLFYMQVVVAAAMVTRPEGARTRQSLARGAGLLAAVWGAAAAVSCPQWLPTLAYLPWSSRAARIPAVPPNWSEHCHALLELALPFPFGDDVGLHHLHTKNVWETAAYPGVVGLAALVACAVRGTRGGTRRARQGRAALAVILLAVYLVMGGVLPGMAGFREPLKARAIAGMGFALAAALGVQWLGAAARLRGARSRARFLLPVVAVPAVLLGLGGKAAVWFAANRAGDVRAYLLTLQPPFDLSGQKSWYEALQNPQRAAQPLGRAGVALGLAGALVAAGAVSTIRWRRAGPLVVVAGACAELAWHGHAGFVSRNPVEPWRLPREFVDCLSPKIAAAERRGEPFRISLPTMLAGRAQFLKGCYETSGYDPLMPLGANTRVALEGMTNEAPWRRMLDGARAVGRLYDYGRMAVPEDPCRDESRWLGAPGATLASLETRVEVVAHDPDRRAGPDVRGQNFLTPPAGLGPEMDEGRIAAAVRRGGFFAEAAALQGGGGGDATGTVRMKPPRSPNRFEFETSTSRPMLLLFRTTWLPGWRVERDGRAEGQPLFANGWMLAAPVGAGVHRVAFIYRPWMWHPALAVSLLGLAGLGIRLRGGRRFPKNRGC